MEFWLGISVFVVSYALIVSERVPKTAAALGGASLMLLLGLIDQDRAFYGRFTGDGSHHFGGVDLNVLVLLGSMMVLVKLLAETGVFKWLAIHVILLTRASPVGILLALSLLTAILSALLDNVTTVLLTVPLAVLVAEQLKIDGRPMVLAQILASNIGGTATLIGDPPNLLIGSAAELGFNDFVVNLAPIVLITLAIFLGSLWLIFRKRLKAPMDLRARLMAMDPKRAITDRRRLIKGLIVLVLTLVGFMTASLLQREPATIALLGAVVLVALDGRKDLEMIIQAIEFDTLLFFFGLFVLVGGLEEVGAIGSLARTVLGMTGGNLFGTSLVLVWFSGIASGIVDNIPLVATVIPLVKSIQADLVLPAGMDPEQALRILWWSLSLGACLGGNGTLVGASANVVAVGIARRAGLKLSFLSFLRWGIPCTLMSLLLSTAYIILRFL